VRVLVERREQQPGRVGHWDGAFHHDVLGIDFLPVQVLVGAAIAIPNLLTAMQRAKQKRTMADWLAVPSSVPSSDHRWASP